MGSLSVLWNDEGFFICWPPQVSSPPHLFSVTVEQWTLLRVKAWCQELSLHLALRHQHIACPEGFLTAWLPFLFVLTKQEDQFRPPVRTKEKNPCPRSRNKELQASWSSALVSPPPQIPQSLIFLSHLWNHLTKFCDWLRVLQKPHSQKQGLTFRRLSH